MPQGAGGAEKSVGVVVSVKGSFAASEESFFVEELPLYEASGEGEHLYVCFEKRGLTTRQVVRRACAVFGVSDKSVGYAGLKDKHATTQQVISIQGAEDTSGLEGDGVRVLEGEAGNRREVGAELLPKLELA